MHAAAQGIYELSLNGRKVGDQQLAPGWTDYARRIQVKSKYALKFDLFDLSDALLYFDLAWLLRFLHARAGWLPLPCPRSG